MGFKVGFSFFQPLANLVLLVINNRTRGEAFLPTSPSLSSLLSHNLSPLTRFCLSHPTTPFPITLSVFYTMASYAESASGTAAYLQTMFGLEGKVAIVTGSTGGLGFALAEALFRAGATVVVNGRGEERALKARDDIYAKVGASL
jgi:phytoene dehydrogenase-like protein